MEKQEYSWRVHRRKKRQMTAWIVCAVLIACAAAFVYEGMRDGNPQKVAERYMDKIQAVDYKMNAGEQSLKNDGTVVQKFTINYKTKDLKEELTEEYDLIKQKKKRYGMFQRWTISRHVEETADFQLILPAQVKGELDQSPLQESWIKEEVDLSKGASLYQIPVLEIKEHQLKITGLPFETYETKFNPQSGMLDVRNELTLSENGRTRMQETGKDAVKDIYTAALSQKAEKDLGNVFTHVKDKGTLLKALKDNMNSDGDLIIDSITFSGFDSTFGDIVYSEPGKDGAITVEAKMKYNYEYKGTRAVYDEEGNRTNETTEETQKGTQTANFVFSWTNREVQIQSAQIPNLLEQSKEQEE